MVTTDSWFEEPQSGPADEGARQVDGVGGLDFSHGLRGVRIVIAVGQDC